MTETSAPTTFENFLTVCNFCEAEPMAPGQERPDQPGACNDCLAQMRPAQ